MDLLVVSLSRAKEIEDIWQGYPINITQGICLAIGICFFAIGFISTITCLIELCSYRYPKKMLPIVGSICMFLVGIISVSGFFAIDNTSAVQIGAAKNVKDYYKMNHLKKIYPKLPCRPKVTHKLCASKSLVKASKNKRAVKDTFTKRKAVIRYDNIKAKYRNTKAPWGTGFKSLKPEVPRWYDWL